MELDNAIATPLYKQLEELILDKITSGTLTPGSKLPTENELSEQYHVSRVTVRKALAALDSQGYLDKKSGKGTFIAEKKMQRSLSPAVVSFSQMCQRMNKKPGAKTIKIAIEDPTPHEAELMGLDETEKILVIERIRYADDKPMLLEINKFPESFSFLFSENLNNTSLYELLKNKHNIVFDHSSKTIDITFASSRDAKILGITKGYPLLRIDSIIHDSTSAYTQLCLQLCIGDKYKLIV